jgi:BlaI family transcriptional regulator, penicillinase repressor
MKRRSQVRPSAGEMELLDILWTLGPSSIAEVHDRLGKAAYTTVQTRLNRLVDKRLALRSADRPARYSAAVGREQVSAGHLGLLVDQLCGGRIVPLVAQLVADRKLSSEEIVELKELIAAAEKSSNTRKGGK